MAGQPGVVVGERVNISQGGHWYFLSLGTSGHARDGY